MQQITTIDWLWGDGEVMLWGDDDVIVMMNEITDAAFLQWLRDQSSHVTLLAEVAFGYQDAGSPAEGTIYLSDRPYCDESPQPYAAVIDGAPTLQRSIEVRELGGRGDASIGELTLANADGAHDYLLERIMDGRDVIFALGDQTWERSQFRQIGAGAVSTVRAGDDGRITLQLRDRNLLLDATIIGDEMTTGPNAGKPKPIVLGEVRNFDLTPYLFDESGPSYYFNNFAMDSSLALSDVQVRDAGVSLVNATVTGDSAAITVDAGTDKIEKTAHGLLDNDVIWLNQAAFGLSALTQYWVVNKSADDWQVAATRGGTPIDLTAAGFTGTLAISSRRYYVDAAAASITLSADPDGRVTADITAIGTSGDAAIQYVPHAGFRYILDTWTRLTSADRDANAFAALVATQQANGTRWGRAILDRTNVMDVLDDIAVLSRSWYCGDKDGLLSVGQFDLANLDDATAIDTIVHDDFLADPSIENLALLFGRLIVDANRNVVTQTDGLATSVSAEDRSTWSQQFQTRVKSTDDDGDQYLVDWWTYHKSAIDSAPLETALVGEDTAVQAFADARAAEFAPWTRVMSCLVGLDKWALDPGDCVEVTYPRYGLDSGVNFRVASVRVKPGDKSVELVLVRQTIPDWDALGVGLTVPDAPTIGTATAGNLKATVTFTAPASNGGASITAYRVTSTPSSITADGSASPIVVTGLSNATAYTFKVKALNSVGYGSESSASNSATPAATVPDPPTEVAAAVASSTSATVTFTAPADNGGSAVLDYTATSSPGGFTSAAGASPRTVTGLTSGVAYTFTVTARNANGSSVASAASNSVTPGNRQIALTIAANIGTGYNIFAQAGYPVDAVDVVLTINAGVDVFADNGTTYTVLTTGTGWATGSTIKIVNNGYILGCGGVGAPATSSGGINGGPGYPAIELRWDVTIDNTNGYIFGGGGGGGSAALKFVYPPGGLVNGGGGGGGAGYGQRSEYQATYGTRLAGGTGYAQYPSTYVGGSGGASGAPGGDGDGGGGAGAGGAGGNAILLNGHGITWIAGNNASQVKGAVS